MKIKKSHNICYRIDKIAHVDEKIEVKGWGIDTEKLQSISLSVMGKSSDGIKVQKEYRNDVLDFLGLSIEEPVGFTIYFDKTWFKYKKKVVLRMRSENNQQDIYIKLNRDIDLSNGKKIPFVQGVIRGYYYLQRHGIKPFANRLYTELIDRFGQKYNHWIAHNEPPVKSVRPFKKTPLISILVPIYNVKWEWLVECIESVLDQSYTNWELCLVDDCSDFQDIQPLLEKYNQNDKRIKVKFRKENGHISRASNDALSMAHGEFVGLLDHDDTLAPFALESVVECINQNEDVDIIYSDEDKINQKGKRCQAFFKPDWSPDTLLSQNYICHFLVVRRKIINDVGGFAIGLEGAQDYDLILKCTERTTKIKHIPQILYHWRMIEESTAVNPESKMYAFDAGKKVLEDTFKRRGKNVIVKEGNALGTYIPYYTVATNPKVSIIIPTRDHAADVKLCIESLLRTINYDDFEIIVVDNNSVEQETFELFKHYEKYLENAFKVLRLEIPFNYSQLNNQAVRLARGDYIVFLNNDIEILTPHWLEIMLGYATQEHIAAVGAKLLYDDETIQHAGVVLGLGGGSESEGVAGHGHKGYAVTEHGYFNKLDIVADYSAVTAAFLMIKKDKFIAVNGFDEENLPVAFNDVDLCIKLLRKGYYNVCLPNVIAVHYESKSRGLENTKEKQQRFTNEVNYMKKTWRTYLQNDPFYNPNLSLKNERFEIKV